MKRVSLLALGMAKLTGPQLPKRPFLNLSKFYRNLPKSVLKTAVNADRVKSLAIRRSSD